MALISTAQAGNWSATATWAGGVVPGDGDRAVINHAVTVDVNTTIGDDRPTQYQGTRPSASATGAGGSLPAGTYAVALAPVNSQGPTTPTALASFNVSLSAGQVIRVVLPAVLPGATGWNIYLPEAGGGTNRKLYASNQTGTVDCSSSLWEDGTIAFASAAAPENGDAIRVNAALTIADGVKLTAKGDICCRAGFNVTATTSAAGVEFDPTTGGGRYRLYSGSFDGTNTSTIDLQGTSSSRAYIQTKSGASPQAQVAPFVLSNGVRPAVRLDCEWALFSRLGGSGYAAVDCYCNQAYNQSLTDCVFDSDCYELDINNVVATGGWILTRVAFRQTTGATHGSRVVCAAFRLANTSADVSDGTRTVTDCAFEVLPPALSRGGATYTGCYFATAWANLPDGQGGSATSLFTLSNSFIRRLMPDATNGSSAVNARGNLTDYYVYQDQVVGGGTDFNPHGLGMDVPASTTLTWLRGTYEYNGDDASGEVNRSPSGSANATIEITNALVIPNGAGLQSGRLIVNSTGTSTFKYKINHPTVINPDYALALAEATTGATGQVDEVQSGLYVGIDTASDHWIMQATAGSPADDIVVASRTRNNAYYNLDDTTGVPDGDWYGPYNYPFSSAPGADDIDLGDDAGLTLADLATYGPEFVDPERNFESWAETIIGASGTRSQIISAGLAALAAIADTTSADHVPGLTATDPATWVRDGFSPQNALLENAGHDGVTIGAIEGTFEAENTGSVAATLAAASLSASGALLITASLTATLGDATLAAEGGSGTAGSLVATLDDSTLDAAGTTSISGSLSATLDAASVAASGTTAIDGSLSATLDDATVAATGSGGEASGSLAVTLDDAVISASGSTAITATLAVALGDVLIFAAGTEHLTLPGAGTTWRARSKPTTCKALAKQMAWKG